jgi:hypothetical protein
MVEYKLQKPAEGTKILGKISRQNKIISLKTRTKKKKSINNQKYKYHKLKLRK